MSNTLNRLKEYIDFKGISVSAFEKKIGMSNASFGKSLKNGGNIGSDKIENILKIFKEINPIWLLTGEGSMLRDSCPVPTENASEVSQYKKDLATKDEIIFMKDDIIKRSDKLIYSMECRIKELEDKQRYFNIEGLGDARIAEQFTLPKSGTLIKK